MCCLIFYVKDEDPKNAWLYLHENDIVAILNQLQMAEVFKHVLLMTSNPDGNMWFRNIFYIKLNICIFWQCEKHLDCLTGSPRYDCHQTSEPLFLKLLAFCTCFVDILGCGLQTYNLPRYKQLNKRIGRMIRYPTKPSWSSCREWMNLMHISKHNLLHCVCVVHSKRVVFFCHHRMTVQYVSDHWENFLELNKRRLSQEQLGRLQLEYNSFFQRCTNTILSAEK